MAGFDGASITFESARRDGMQTGCRMQNANTLVLGSNAKQRALLRFYSPLLHRYFLLAVFDIAVLSARRESEGKRGRDLAFPRVFLQARTREGCLSLVERDGIGRAGNATLK
jgi:hypothetical protein